MGKTPRPVDTGITPGTILLGKYRVDELLGQGGMGVVAACTHLALHEKVAIKMLRGDVMLDNDAVERFMREAQAAVKLRSEHVARVTDVGAFDDGVPYMVMEFLDGHDLGELIEQRGCLPYPWATELVLQAAEALAEAHSIGIVHRDVKPTNLFVTWRPDGSAIIKVLDFGISKAPMGTDMQLTQTQSLLGTPAYMSPEQMRSARMVDARTDIWSLGTVMYELLEGRRPFEAESFSEMCVKVAVDQPAPMVNTPPQLQQVIFRCLAKSPEQRYSNMAELGRDLVPFAQDPHQAQMLVERMTRTIGRRGGNVEGGWDGASTNSGVRSQPGLKQIRDMKSGPVAMPNWHGGSEVGLQPFMPRTPAPGQLHAPAIPAPIGSREVSTAVATSVVAAQKRTPWGILVGFALVIAIAVVVMIVVTGKQQPANRAAPVADPGAGQATDQAADKAAADKAATEAAAAQQAAAEKAAAEKAAAEQAAAEQAAATPVEKPTKPGEKKPVVVKRPPKPPPKPPKEVKDKPKEPDPPPQTKAIDPFATSRPPGAPKK